MTDTAARVVLVTGASSGIGLATAVSAADAGFRVVATVRDLERVSDLRDAARTVGVERGIEIAELDVTDAASITACVDGVIARHGRLDALVNNAGVGRVGTLENDTMEEIRASFEVNFFGVVALTRAALPHLRATSGRVVSVTSVGGIVGQPFNETYCAAKFAVEGFMEGLAPVAASVGVHVSVIEPGAVASAFVANAGLDPERMIAEAGPYAGALTRYLERTAGAFADAQSPEAVAEVIVSALMVRSPDFRIQTSAAARAFVGAKLADLDGSAVQSVTRGWVASG